MVSRRELLEAVGTQQVPNAGGSGPPAPGLGTPAAPARAFDWVADASFDSFPASDAPSWTGVHVGSPG